MAEYAPSSGDVTALRSRAEAGAEREADLTTALQVAHALLAEHLGEQAKGVPGPVLTEQRLDVAARVFRLRST